jgi:hypothetical protein
MRNSNDHIGNRTHDDLPTCSAVPYPIAPLRILKKYRITADIKRTRCTGVCYIQESNTRLSASSRHFIKLHIDDNGDLSTIAL